MTLLLFKKKMYHTKIRKENLDNLPFENKNLRYEILIHKNSSNFVYLHSTEEISCELEIFYHPEFLQCYLKFEMALFPMISGSTAYSVSIRSLAELQKLLV